MTRAEVIQWAIEHAAPGVTISALPGVCPGLLMDDGQVLWRQYLTQATDAHTRLALVEHWPRCIVIADEERAELVAAREAV